MNNINRDELRKFIEENTNKELTPQEINKEIMLISLSLFQEITKALKQALKEKDSTMVAVITELLKSY